MRGGVGISFPQTWRRPDLIQTIKAGDVLGWSWLSPPYGRKLIVGDCKQLKTSVDSYNDNNKHGHYVEVSFNFAEDMEESEQPTVYPGL